MSSITSPEKVPVWPGQPTLFLAGSIDQGEADDWQTAVINAHGTSDVLFLNPRRQEWDKEADESLVREQINWELNALEIASALVIYFQPHSLSPISLLELGLYARSKKLVVCCPGGFWRHTNVAVTCSRFQVPVHDNLCVAVEAAISLARDNFDRVHGVPPRV